MTVAMGDLEAECMRAAGGDEQRVLGGVAVGVGADECDVHGVGLGGLLELVDGADDGGGVVVDASDGSDAAGDGDGGDDDGVVGDHAEHRGGCWR